MNILNASKVNGTKNSLETMLNQQRLLKHSENNMFRPHMNIFIVCTAI